MNLFSWINELFVGKRDWDSFSDADKKKFSPFMVNRYLSMSEDFIPFVNHFQKYTIEVMPHKSVYQFYCNLLPKKKTYLKYLSGKKEKTNDKVVPYIMEYFEVSKKEAADYYDIMEKMNLKLLLKKDENLKSVELVHSRYFHLLL